MGLDSHAFVIVYFDHSSFPKPQCYYCAHARCVHSALAIPARASGPFLNKKLFLKATSCVLL